MSHKIVQHGKKKFEQSSELFDSNRKFKSRNLQNLKSIMKFECQTVKAVTKQVSYWLTHFQQSLPQGSLQAVEQQQEKVRKT